MTEASLQGVFLNVNRYDCEGDCIERGVFLHVGTTSVKVAESIEAFKATMSQLHRMVNEIEENYEAMQ